MVSLYQRLLIVILLLISIAGRITVYAIANPKSKLEIVKENSSKADKYCASESNEQLEEKLKLEDLAINRLIDAAFIKIAKSKAIIFAGDYKLLKCYLHTLEYPPK